MKAALCVRHGPPEALEIAELPDPVAGPGEILVEIKATGLNFFDTLIIADRYQVKPALPFSPGAEFAGIVRALGPGVGGLVVGDRVCGYVSYGAAREQLAVPAGAVTQIPKGLEFERAAGVTVTYGTALHALTDRAQLRKGEVLAVLGAAGGVGLAAVETGKLLGARVIACASSEDKLAFAREHGADDLIDYSREDLKERLRALTGGRGADIVFDPVGGALAEPAVRGTAWGGRYLVIGFTGGIPKLALNHVLLRGCAVVGVAWGAMARHDAKRLRDILQQTVTWAAEGRISAHVGAVYPLDRIAEALTLLAQRKAKGKIVLRP